MDLVQFEGTEQKIKGGKMKIAVTSKGSDLDAEVDPRFGRAAYIIVVDSETFNFEVLDNKDNATFNLAVSLKLRRAIVLLLLCIFLKFFY